MKTWKKIVRVVCTVAFCSLFVNCPIASADIYDELAMVDKMISYGISDSLIMKTYKKGDRGRHILELKEILQDYGYYTPDATFDDEFNSTMVERVKMFQKNNGLRATGSIDIVTHGSILLASDATVKGKWYKEKTVNGADEMIETVMDYCNSLIKRGNAKNVAGTAYYFGRVSSKRTLYNDTVAQFAYDQSQVVFTADGCQQMMYQSFSEMRMTSSVLNVNDPPINLKMLDELLNQSENLYLELLESAYVYGYIEKEKLHWDICPFIVTEQKGSEISVDRTLYIYSRMVQEGKSGADQYTEVYISDPKVVGKLVDLLEEADIGIEKTKIRQMRQYL